MTTKKSQKVAKQFICENCDYECCKKSDYEKHLTTRKHKNTTIRDKVQQENLHTFICCCGKSYNHRASLFNHKKKCTYNNDGEPIVNKNIIELLIKENLEMKNVVLEIVKSNSELQKHLVDVCKNTSTINSNNNHSHNKTFNLQFFLNEQCKDAMNISDFANSFELELSDLESVGDLGYVEGITKIFLDKLNSMDIYKRPIHCSDAKREILYVKDDNKWEREERNNPKIRYAIKTISFRNMKLAVLWSETYPESKDCDSRVNERYMKLIKESTGGSGEIIENENKIIRRIAKEIVIDKK